jgi:crotonobetainyl-CoA:carnitine CoA-transferase CaiB-like acyl-CoA transferase
VTEHEAALPLKGIRIIDISNVFSLPYAGGLLADLGAEVIKIEGPARLDVSRGGAFSGVYPDNEAGDDPWNRSSAYNLLNRGKKSLAIDLRRPEGREVLKDLIKVSDVLTENFTPRVMRGWELDYPSARKLNPKLIMVSCSGYGPQGPYAQYPAQATAQEATHGLAYVTGYRGDIPSKAGQSFVDFLATWALVMGTTLALRYRHRFGKGLWVDVAMYQLGCTMVADRILDWEANQRLGERIGNRHPWLAPQGCYRCAGEDAWCVISVHDDAEWAALCRVIGRPELATDPRFAGNAGRMRDHDAIDTIIGAWTARHAKFEAMELLQSAGVRAGAVFNARDMHLDRHAKARGLLETVSFPPEREIGERMIIGRPWKLSKIPLAARGPAPCLGQHNREVLRDILGYDEARYAALEAAGVIGTKPTVPRPVIRMSMDERVRRGRLASWDPDYKERLGVQGRSL